MGVGEIFISFAVAGVLICLSVAATEMFKRHIEFKERQLAAHSTQAELEKRLAVLERIVTDGGYSIATQIEALRDAPATHTDAGVPLAINKENV